jgi:hypothetical protein
LNFLKKSTPLNNNFKFYLVYNNLNLSNNFNENIQNKRENDIIIPAYKTREFTNDEAIVQAKCGIFINNQNSINLSKSVYNNNMASSSNYNSNSNNNNKQNTINYIPCINCNNMVGIDDIGTI